MKKNLSRRKFCQDTVLASAAFAFSGSLTKGNTLRPGRRPMAGDGPEIIDTNVHLFDYPFRNLKYSRTKDMIQKLQKHKVTKAWAGSFEYLFHKNIDLANRKLLEECTKNSQGMFIPVGSVNLTWPDWEEDLRRLKEDYKMDIVRIYPIYQMTKLGEEEFDKFMKLATQYELLVQIVGDVEDRRHHHPILEVWDINFEPLIEVGKKYKNTKIQLVHWNKRVRGDLLSKIASETNFVFDTSRIEGAGELGGLLHADSWYGPDFEIAPERFLFGTHVPYFPVESALLKMFESPLNENEFNLIARGNAEKLIKV